jgi:anti-sigma factor RsiW
VLSPDALREAERHVASCPDCSQRVSKYRQVVERLSTAKVSQAAPETAGCPKDEDVDWYEVASGKWPEFKARQLILHAALCEHCGPLLRAATSAAVSGDDPTPQEARFVAELKTPSRPKFAVQPARRPSRHWPVLRWLAPAMAMLLLAGVFVTRPRSSTTEMSSADFAEYAVRAHQQHAQGSLALDVRSDSQQTVNEWFQQKLPFALTLPASGESPDDSAPNRLEGARLVQIGSKIGTKTAAFIAYNMQTSAGALPVSLMVTPNSVAVASGGVEVSFKKVSFHYGMVQGYRVVTWSLHGLTYALVSQESGNTQRSCMVCHSAMKDRDLSQTPPPLLAQGQPASPIPQ